MPFYIRKSLSFGPIRFNLSKSGVGVSAGIKGFRIGSGPRGNYVQMGRGGLYYRASLPSGQGSPTNSTSTGRSPTPPSLPPEATVQMVEVDSASAGLITDSSSLALVAEIQGKKRLFRFAPLALAIGAALFATGLVQNWSKGVELTIVLVAIAAYIPLSVWDTNRKTTVIFYDLIGDAESVYRRVYIAFEGLSNSQRIWHVPSRGAVLDRKYHAGAGELVTRKEAKVKFDNPPFIQTNVPTPSLSVGTQTLYFFPDKVLIYDRNDVGGLSYDSISADISIIQFIESESPPSDAKRIGETWRYVNKKGGPDRRFKDNVQIPIMQYEQVHLRSRSGLNELLHVSRLGRFQIVMDAIQAIAVHARE
jgi:hypothetical protein